MESLLYCLGVFGRASAGVAVAEVKRRYGDYIFDNGIPEKLLTEVKDCEWIIIPSVDLAAGLQFECWDFCCADWVFQIGYEIHSMCNLPDFLQFQTGVSEFGITQPSGNLTHNKSTLGFDGFHFRGNIYF